MRLRTAIATLALTLVAAAPASAAMRYVKQGGTTTTTATCTMAAPCDPATAINGGNTKVQAGDTIVVLASATPIDVTAAPLAPTKQLTIEGDPSSATRPIIEDTASNSDTLRITQPGTQVSHLDLRTSGPVNAAALIASTTAGVDDVTITTDSIGALLSGGAALTNATVSVVNGADTEPVGVDADGPATIADTTVNATGSQPSLFGLELSTGSVAHDVTITSSQHGVSVEGGGTLTRARVAATTGALTALEANVSDSVLVTANGDAVAGSGGPITLRNVTAISGTGNGLSATSGLGVSAIDARNVIARGGPGALDVFAGPPSLCSIPPCPPGTVAIDHSNFRTTSASNVTDRGANQSADPQFVSPATGDYHLQATSPAIDAGVDDPADGTTDLDGTPRIQGPAPDLGAYEHTALPPTPAPAPVPPPPPPADRTPPAITHASLTHTTFAVSGSPTAIAAKAQPKHKTVARGTAIRFTLSEAGAVTITISRAEAGRRKGHSCVKPTTSLRRARTCTRYVGLTPSLRRTISKPGAERVAFSGRLGRTALKPGHYEATIKARDAAGNVSKPATLHFTVSAAT